MSKRRKKSKSKASALPPSKMTPGQQAWDAFLRFWFGPVRRSRMVVWQRAFALTFIIYQAGWAIYAPEWLTDFGFHLTPEMTNPVYPMPFPTLPSWALIPFLLVNFSAATLLVLDVATVPARMVCAVIAVYVQLVDQISSFTLNKLYIVGFVILVLTPNGTWHKGEDGVVRRYTTAWTLRTMQLTLLLQYFTAGWCKLVNGDWIERWQDVLFTHSVGIYRTEIAGWVVTTLPDVVWPLLAIGSIAFECGAPFGFLFKRTRLFTAIFGIGFHLSIAVLMKDLIYFSLQMCTFYLWFLSDEWADKIDDYCARHVDRLKDRVRALIGRQPTTSAPSSTEN